MTSAALTCGDLERTAIEVAFDGIIDLTASGEFRYFEAGSQLGALGRRRITLWVEVKHR